MKGDCGETGDIAHQVSLYIVEIVKICILGGGSSYFDPNGAEVYVGEWWVVEGKYGTDLGKVLWKCKLRSGKFPKTMFKVLHKATKAEHRKAAENKINEAQARKTCMQKIAARGLPMKLSVVKYPLDGERIVFYFTATRRVDFRHLVKDLAQTFRKRIEMIQVGVRDEASMLSGCGRCGRPLCCSSFIEDFESVHIKMAKTQDVSLTPEKISGICGRLSCCLQYENDWYLEAQAKMPKVSERVNTPQGEGVVESVNLFKETVRVSLDDGEHIEVESADVIL